MPIYSARYLEIQNSISEFLENNFGSDKYQKILIGVSGGADSLALAQTVINANDKHTLIPIIVDHGLQEISKEVTQNTKTILLKMGYEQVEIFKVNVELEDGVEASARRARYRAFYTCLENFNSNVMLLAHTQDDQAETVLMGLARGSGTRSLSGMAKLNPPFFRPLLDFTRKDTELICQEFKLKFWDDEFNHDNKYLRARIRNNLRPALEFAIGENTYQALAKSAQILQSDQDFIIGYVQNELQDLARSAKFELPLEISISRLGKIHDAVRLRVFRELLYFLGAPSGKINYDHLQRCNSLVIDYHGQKKIDLPGLISLSRQGEKLIFDRTVRKV